MYNYVLLQTFNIKNKLYSILILEHSYHKIIPKSKKTFQKEHFI